MKKVVLPSALILSLLSGCAVDQAIDRPTIFKSLTGIWDEENPATCEFSRALSFSDDGRTMTATFPETGYASERDARKSFDYEILEVNESWLRMALLDEPRTDADGKPVVWILKLIDEDTFCWGREDWQPYECTPPRFRCDT